MRKYRFLVLLVITLITTFGFYAIETFFIIKKVENISSIKAIITLLTYTLTALVGFKIFNIKLNVYKSFKLSNSLIIMLMAIGLLLCNVVFSLLFIDKDQFILQSNYLPEFNTSFALVILLFPIVEEFFFRNLFCDVLLKNYSFTKTIFLSAILFSIAHIFSDTGFITSFTGGVFLAYIYLKTKNIALSIIAHIIINILNFPIIFGLGYSLKSIDFLYYNFYIWYFFLILLSSIFISLGYYLLKKIN